MLKFRYGYRLAIDNYYLPHDFSYQWFLYSESIRVDSFGQKIVENLKFESVYVWSGNEVAREGSVVDVSGIRGETPIDSETRCDVSFTTPQVFSNWGDVFKVNIFVIVL